MSASLHRHLGISCLPIKGMGYDVLNGSANINGNIVASFNVISRPGVQVLIDINAHVVPGG